MKKLKIQNPIPHFQALILQHLLRQWLLIVQNAPDSKPLVFVSPSCTCHNIGRSISVEVDISTPKLIGYQPKTLAEWMCRVDNRLGTYFLLTIDGGVSNLFLLNISLYDKYDKHDKYSKGCYQKKISSKVKTLAELAWKKYQNILLFYIKYCMKEKH